MKKKKASLLFAGIMLAASLTGCMRASSVVDTTKSDTEYHMKTVALYDKQKVDGMAANPISMPGSAEGDYGFLSDTDMLKQAIGEIQGLKVVTVKGKEYYKQKAEREKRPYFSGGTDDGAIVTTSSFYASTPATVIGEEEAQQLGQAGMAVSEVVEKVTIKIKFRDPIKETNGKVGKDGKTVRFVADAGEIGAGGGSSAPAEAYAYTTTAARTLEEDRAAAKE